MTANKLEGKARELEQGWRDQARRHRECGPNGMMLAEVRERCADELAAVLSALDTARQPDNLGEFVIAMLIASGYVTQAKVDEARKIALSHGPYELPARQSEGMVLVPREPTDEMLIAAGTVSGWDGNPNTADTDHIAWWKAMIAAAPADAGEGCGCRACRPLSVSDMRMIVCATCGNKRCPHANDHRYECTNSNEPGQPGSAYPATQPERDGRGNGR